MKLEDARDVVKQLGIQGVHQKWAILRGIIDTEKLAQIIARFGGRPTTIDRTCPKCGRTFNRVDYGTQAYCRDCWRAYDKKRRAEARITEQGLSDIDQIQEAITEGHLDYDSFPPSIQADIDEANKE